MDISSDLAVIALLLAGLLAYIAFQLWTPQKRFEPTNKLISFLLSLIFSILLGFVYLLGFTLSGTVFSLMTFGHIVSYILAGICSIFICAYTIKSLPSKIGNGTVYSLFCRISFIVYLVIGIGEIVTALSSSFVLSSLPNAIFDMTIVGISNIGVALCAVRIRLSLKKSLAASGALSAPVQTVPPTEGTSADTSNSEQDTFPIVNDSSDSVVPSRVPATQPPKDSASPKVVIHFSVNKKVFLAIAFVAVLSVGILAGLLLGEGYFAPQFTPSSPFIDSLMNAADVSYSNGYRNGYTSGQINGYNSGSEVGQSDAYNKGWLDGWDEGYSSGYQEGYDDGYYAY